MEMSIADGTAGSTPEISAQLIKASDSKFIQLSQAVPDKLAAPQISRTFPGCAKPWRGGKRLCKPFASTFRHHSRLDYREFLPLRPIQN
jgi:hypothetical protein